LQADDILRAWSTFNSKQKIKLIRKLILLASLSLVSTPAFAQSVDTAWVRAYHGPADTLDCAKALAVDDWGNVFVTGYSAQSATYPHNLDYVTVKYDPEGNQVWAERYNGPGNYEDQAAAVTKDDSGNVYVTGYSYAGGTYYDFATIKYLPDGDTAWVRRYSGVDQFADRAWYIVVGNWGDVYVTGTSDGIGIGPDYVTIRYFPNGDTAWVRRYNGPRNDCDTTSALVVDNSGNVYVTGFSFGIGTLYDYATIKYDSSGTEVWLSRYNGPVNRDDIARDMEVDSWGNVYVTGRGRGEDTFFDYLTIRYYPNGDTVWVRRYNGPKNDWDYAYDVTVDDSGNVYVTGATPGSLFPYTFNYATIKYDSSGNQLWVRHFDSPGSGSDIPYAMVMDGSGNIYVTGTGGTVKYDAEGNQLWAGPWGGVDIALNSLNNVYVIHGTSDYIIAKYVQFLRGDVNNDNWVSIIDVVYLVNYLFQSGSEPFPAPIVGDSNCDDTIGISDAVYLINYLFRSGPVPGDPDDDGVPDC
jgi:hypothetical protein